MTKKQKTLKPLKWILKIEHEGRWDDESDFLIPTVKQTFKGTSINDLVKKYKEINSIMEEENRRYVNNTEKFNRKLTKEEKIKLNTIHS